MPFDISGQYHIEYFMDLAQLINKSVEHKRRSWLGIFCVYRLNYY